MLVCTVIVGGLLCFDKCTNKKENQEKANLLSEILMHPCNARCSVDYRPSEHLALGAAFFGGPGWTRTNDGKTGGFTVRCHSR